MNHIWTSNSIILRQITFGAPPHALKSDSNLSGLESDSAACGWWVVVVGRGDVTSSSAHVL